MGSFLKEQTMTTFGSAPVVNCQSGWFRAELTRRYFDGGTMVRTIVFRAADLAGAVGAAHDRALDELVSNPRISGADISNVQPAEGE